MANLRELNLDRIVDPLWVVDLYLKNAHAKNDLEEVARLSDASYRALRARDVYNEKLTQLCNVAQVELDWLRLSTASGAVELNLVKNLLTMERTMRHGGLIGDFALRSNAAAAVYATELDILARWLAAEYDALELVE